LNDPFPAPPAANCATVEDMAARGYQLIVEGELCDEFELVFEGFTLTRAAGTTTLTGIVRDQAELQGILQRLSNLGTLLELTAIDEGGQASRA
jgi:hypothetical protein